MIRIGSIEDHQLAHAACGEVEAPHVVRPRRALDDLLPQ